MAMLLSVGAIAQDQGYLVAEYRIGPEDVLDISVWKEPDLTRQVLVRPDGGLSFPLAGDIQAAGKTTTEIQALITERLRRYIPEAVVSVSAVKLAGYRIYILGKVNNPGEFVPGRYLDVLQALTMAGGLTPFASKGKISIVRRDGDSLSVLPFDFADMEKGRNLDQNILLKTGDTVVVP
jgi:polysaccharide export outer membrane protein